MSEPMCPHRAPDGSALGFPVSGGGRLIAWHLSPGHMTDTSLVYYAEIGRAGCVIDSSDELQGDRWRREMARAELRRRNAMEAA